MCDKKNHIQNILKISVIESELKYWCSLDITDLDWGSNSKAWIQGLNKGGFKSVQQGHGVANAVKCQHTCTVVQVHTDLGRVRAMDGLVHSVVPGRVTRVRAEQTPGFIIVAQQAQWAFAFAADAFIGHSNGELSTPLDLPVVAASRQGLSA